MPKDRPAVYFKSNSDEIQSPVLPEKLLTVQNFRTRLKKILGQPPAVSTVYLWIDEGKISCIYLGPTRRIRIPETEIPKHFSNFLTS